MRKTLHDSHSKQGNHDEGESRTKSFLHNATLDPLLRLTRQNSATHPAAVTRRGSNINTDNHDTP